MRWVDLFAIDTFLASGQRVPDGDQPEVEREDEDETGPLAEGTERIERIDDRFDDLDGDGDEWDAETLVEIPENFEIPGDDSVGDDAAIATPEPWPVRTALLRRLS